MYPNYKIFKFSLISLGYYGLEGLAQLEYNPSPPSHGRFPKLLHGLWWRADRPRYASSFQANSVYRKILKHHAQQSFKKYDTYDTS